MTSENQCKLISGLLSLTSECVSEFGVFKKWPTKLKGKEYKYEDDKKNERERSSSEEKEENSINK